MDEIGLFPLPLVLMPGEQAPLHVFEPRYRELISECLARGEDFGLVLADDEGMRDVGTRAFVVEVLEQFPDGRMNVVIEGRERFRLKNVAEDRAFATAEIDEVEDEGDEPTEEERAAALEAYDRVVKAADADLDELDLEAENLAFQIAARIDLGAEVKQTLLESQSERDRVVRLAGLLDKAAEAVAREREIRGRASGNGRVEAL
jgi:ATP-dependent Lon protease